MRKGRKMGIFICRLFLGIMLLFSFAVPAYSAPVDLDQAGNQQSGGSGSSGYNDSIQSYMKHNEVVSEEQMQQARSIASPITNIIGTAVGVGTALVSAGIFLITILDILYIALPPIRSYLAPASSSGGGMSGFGGGFGSMGGTQQSSGRQWVSDEALSAISSAGSQSGSSMGMGGFGGGFGGSMGGTQQKPKNAFSQYFKSRAITLIFFTICLITLTSSIFTDCGLNLAELLFKVMIDINNFIANFK